MELTVLKLYALIVIRLVISLLTVLLSTTTSSQRIKNAYHVTYLMLRLVS